MSAEQGSENVSIKCSYCNNTDRQSLLQCRICRQWFCNSSELSQGSHIYLHLSLAKHKCVATTKQSVFRGSILKCSECGNTNVFDLRYDSRKKDAVPKFLCVSMCIAKMCLGSQSFDDSFFLPIVDNRRFVHNIIPVCPPSQKSDVNLTHELIRQFEIMKLSYPTIPITAIKLNSSINLQAIKRDYEDTLEYYNTFEPLVKLEKSEEQQAIQMDGDKHILVNFFREYEKGNPYVVATFSIHMSEYSRDPKQWDELVLTWSFIQDDFDEEQDYKKRLKSLENRRKKNSQTDESDALIQFLDDENELDEDVHIDSRFTNVDVKNRVEYSGRVMSMEVVDVSIGHYRCKLKVERKQVPLGGRAFVSGYYDIRLQDAFSTVNRRLAAIKRLDDENCIHQILFDNILGNKSSFNHTHFYIPKRVIETTDFNAPNLRPLNESQREAVISALTSRLTLIQGPPGTGKTNTGAAIVYHLIKRNREQLPDIPKKYKECYGKKEEAYRFTKPGPILVSVPSNVAADEICRRISKTGVKVVRLMALSKQEQPSPVQNLCVHVLARKLMEELYPHQLPIQKKRANGEHIEQKAWQSYLHDVAICERKVIQESEVVVSTCDTAGAKVLNEIRFNTVLVDEASQATEPETLVPITHGAQRVILIGDQRQLQPVVLSAQCKRCGYERSLFERLIFLGQRTVLLNVQYRMHPVLSAFSNKMFYENRLKDGVRDGQRLIHPRINYPTKTAPMLFWNVVGKETVGGNGGSYMNMTEGRCVIELTKHLLASGIKAEQIGIITSYTGQKLLIQNLLKKSNIENVEFASVNMYQGREKDYIIFSCVRSNVQNVIGFLKDQRRLNVALTRARFGLFVVGNAQLLKSDSAWSSYIDYHNGYETIVEGKVDRWISRKF